MLGWRARIRGAMTLNVTARCVECACSSACLLSFGFFGTTHRTSDGLTMRSSPPSPPSRRIGITHRASRASCHNSCVETSDISYFMETHVDPYRARFVPLFSGALSVPSVRAPFCLFSTARCGSAECQRKICPLVCRRRRRIQPPRPPAPNKTNAAKRAYVPTQ